MKGRRNIKSEQKGHSVQQMKLAGTKLETMISLPLSLRGKEATDDEIINQG